MFLKCSCFYVVTEAGCISKFVLKNQSCKGFTHEPGQIFQRWKFTTAEEYSEPNIYDRAFCVNREQSSAVFSQKAPF